MLIQALQTIVNTILTEANCEKELQHLQEDSVIEPFQFLNQARSTPGFLKLLSGKSACVFVCVSTPKLRIKKPNEV